MTTTTATIAAADLTEGMTILRTRYRGNDPIVTKHTVKVANRGLDGRDKPAIVALCTGDRVFTLSPTEQVTIVREA